MRAVEFTFQLFDDNGEPVGEEVAVKISETGLTKSIFIDGRDYLEMTGEQLMRAMLTERSIERLLEKEFPIRLENYDVFAQRRYGAL